MYISLLEDTITWVELRELEPFLPGLESAWSHDTLLDGPQSDIPLQTSEGELSEAAVAEQRPAGDMLLSLPTIESSSSMKLKRHASRISRTPSFSSSTEEEDSRTKLRQLCNGAEVDLVGRCAEIV